eukprot:CAMPEP_0197180378 /NCGR_PEP_ID=MMETSP1423-20130617/5013_1 /TAXON_ID=476441 /ORGANISM="Pseudo-nitzschia heimii, Strain UNC1101" /LENGTH=525 /DNA_ID=CAMNT_0042630449 /DNA_START=267 /DNA_END=1847 /DNA_ORIENTATION=+
MSYENEGSADRLSSPKTSILARKTATKRQQRKVKGSMKKKNSQNRENNSKPEKVSRPTSFAAIRKEMRKYTEINNKNSHKGSIEEGSSLRNNNAEDVIDSDTISRISRRRHRERLQEQRARSLAKEERKELKVKLYELSDSIDRGFRSTPQEAKEMKAVIDRLTELNPTTEPAWSYYGKKNPLTRQLYQSLAKPKKKDENQNENDDLASLEGKWILTYTNVPSVVALAKQSNFAKLGRIGQECTPFPDYTVRTIIEWKRPDWVQNLETNLPGAVSRRLFGKAESSVLQKTTLRARATPDDPTSWGVSTVPRVFEVVSSRSSSALYDDDDDDDEMHDSTLSFVTDDGLVALDPLKPLKIGLQIAGMNDEQDLFGVNDDEDEGGKRQKGGVTSLVTDTGLVALNPFQPWTVGLQMAGFAGRDDGLSKSSKKANEPWKIEEDVAESNNNLFKDIDERGLVEGVLKQIPIQFKLSGDDVDEKLESRQKERNSKTRILYLDDDIRIIGDGENHVTVETRACTDGDDDCWF